MLVENFRTRGISTLTSIQTLAIRSGLLDGHNLVISAPTSAGKTTIAELAAIAASLSGKKTVYLVTHRALAEEKYRQFKSAYDDETDPWFEVSISTGDRHEGNWLSGICIATYEKFLSSIANQAVQGFENLVVVADEIQTVGDSTRGADIELLCSILLQAEPHQFIGLTATMPNSDQIASWLRSTECKTSIRDVPLRQEIWFNGKVTYCNSVDSEAFSDETLQIPQSRDSVTVANHLISQGKGPVLVFCLTKRRAEELAEEFSDSPEGSDSLSDLGRQLDLFSEPTSLGRMLRKVAASRVAFHTADLSFSERAVIEQAIIDGQVEIVFATPTLAAGVNLPIRSVVFDSIGRRWLNPPWLPQAEYMNMAGRAGRLGFHDRGDVVLLPINNVEFNIAHNFITNQPEKVESVLAESSIRKPVLQLLACGVCKDRESLVSFFRGSLWYHQKLEQDSNLDEKINLKISQALTWLIDQRLCLVNNESLVTTELGRAISATGLLPSTAITMMQHLAGLSRSDIENREFALLHLACASDEFKEGTGRRFLPFANQGRAEISAYNSVRAATPFIDPDLVHDQPRVDNASYALSLWLSGTAERDLSRAVPQIRYGQLQAMSQDVGWIFEGIQTLLACPAIDSDPTVHTEISIFAKRVKLGVTSSAVDILEAAQSESVPGFGRHRAMVLANAEVSHPNKLLELGSEALSELIENSERAVALIAAVSNMFRKPMQFWRARHIHKAKEVNADINLIELLYDVDGGEYEKHVLTVFKRLGFNAEIFDREGRQGVPDIIIRLDSGNVFVECKSRENKKNTPISTEDAFAILTKANDLSPLHCVTIAKPGAGTHVKKKATENGAVTVVEHKTLVQCYLAHHCGMVPMHLLEEWLLQSGMAKDFEW